MKSLNSSCFHSRQHRSSKQKRRKLRKKFSGQGFESLEPRRLLAAGIGSDGSYFALDAELVAFTEPKPVAIEDYVGSNSPAVAGLAATVSVTSPTTVGTAENIIFVDDDASGLNNGSSWEDAYNNLQSGLVAAAVSQGSDEIRVAEGVYLPSSFGNRFATFRLSDGVSLRGGYAGSSDQPELRDSDLYPTVLSGDIGIPNFEFDNSYHVVSISAASALLEGVTVTEGRASSFFGPNGTGGGIYANFNSSVTLHDVEVTDNFASNAGGGIFTIGNTEITIAGSSITENSARFGGGALFDNSIVEINDSDFENNSAFSSGGGIYSFSSEVALDDLSVSNNSAGFRGGGVYSTNSSLEFNEVEISSNAANSSGGGVYAFASDLVLTTTNFIENSSDSTGGGLLSDTGTVVFEGGQVIGNTAGNNGGGLYPFRSTATITDAVFKDNSSDFFGGGLQVREGSVTVKNAEFYNNTARLSGGGINVDSPSSTADISNVIADSNSARNGGGIANLRSTMTLSDSVVNNNDALFGGGIRNLFGSLEISNVSVANNTAEVNAGGLVNFRGQVSIDSGEFAGNRALGINSENFQFVIGRGGAIENVGLGFGALLEVSNTVFHRNFAATQGAAIDNNGPEAQLVISDSRVSQGEAGVNGGGLFNEGTATIERVHFAHNVAQQDGGGIYIAGGVVNVVDSRFTGNKAKADKLGTAIYVAIGGNLNLDDLTVISKEGTPVYYES